LKQKISILGCGWLGRALAIELFKKGNRVYGSNTSGLHHDKLKSQGISTFIINIGERGVDISDFLSSTILIIAITSKNIDDIENLIQQIENSKIEKVLFISSTSVYPNTNGIVKEDTPINNSKLSIIELLFRSNKAFETTVLRFGGLFGYDRMPGNFIKATKKIENPEGYINFIHRDDCIQIIEQIIKNKAWGETLNACADSHPKRRAFYKNEFKKVGRIDLAFHENALSTFKIVSSEKLMKLLKYKFKYSDLLNY